MANEWVAMALGDVACFTSGGTPSKEDASYWSGHIPWLSAKDMKAFIIEDTKDHITEEGLQNGSRLAPVGTVFLLARGMTLLNDLPICISRRPMAFNQDVKGLAANDTLLDVEFLPYLLLGHKTTLMNLVDLAGHGTGRLNTDELKSLRVSVPPKEEQCAIAGFLRSLDEKIELNRKMNETLEAMARALFKSWFVDFDPVRAKAEGRPTGLPDSIAALFPNSFQNSELGPIPTGWTVGSLADVASLNPECWAKDTKPDIIRYIDLANTKWGKIEAIASYSKTEAPSRAQRILRCGDTIVGTVRPGNGSYALIAEDGLTGSTGFAVLRPQKSEHREFIYLTATAPENIESLAHVADGGAYPAVRPEVVIAKKVVMPPETVIAHFSESAEPLISRLAQGNRQSQTLAAMRDTLLPKLISGEIRVKEASQLVGAAL